MLLIYSNTISTRLQYICNFIFKEQLGIEFRLTLDAEYFKNYTGIKLNYSNSRITPDEFFIQNNPLLFEQHIQQQNIECFIINNNKAFFKTEESDFPFDILSASFYLLSRYEENLPHEKDMYGRYAHENSLAFKEGFLNIPLINFWLKDFAAALISKNPTLNFQLSTFNFLPTYDIDIAYSFKYKGLLRNIGGFLKSPSIERIKVLAGTVKDPFDCYEWLTKLHEENKLEPVYFFLVAQKNGHYDKNILPGRDAMWKLVKQQTRLYEIGVHPSWQSNADNSILKSEINTLGEMSGIKKITTSRQHYIKFNLPQSFQNLIAAGIHDDYSMGYGSINGFRASVASSIFWYDLEKEQQTALRLHPFCFMDANSFYEQQQNTEQTAKELKHYLSVCKSINGTMITIWHNDFLGTGSKFEGWREIYKTFITSLPQQ